MNVEADETFRTAFAAVTARLRIRTVIQKRTIEDSKAQTLALLVSMAPNEFKGVSRCFGSDSGLKGAENGLEHLPIANRSLYACFDTSNGSRRPRTRSTAAKTVTETEIPQIMKNSVSVRTWKARNGLDRSCR
jgi:hypothetical protein